MQQLEHLRSLYQLTAILSQTDVAEEVYEAALDSLQRTLKSDRAAILLFDSDGVVRFKAWRGLSEAYRKAAEGHSPWRLDARDPQPVLVPDAQEAPKLASLRRAFSDEGIGAMGFIPLIHHGRLVGNFIFYYNGPHVFGVEEVEFAQAVVRHIAFAIARERAEKALRESETLLRTVIQSEPECVKLLDFNGCILDMNSAGLALIEADSLDQVKGLPIVDLVAPHDRAAFQALNTRVFAGDSGTLRFEIVGLKGVRRWLETHAAPLRNADGEVTALIGLTRDITQRKQAEEAVSRRDLVLSAVAFSAEHLLKMPTWDQAIQDVLARLGQAADASRVYIFENHTSADGELLTSLQYEWSALGIQPQIDNPDLQNFPVVASGFGRWVEVMSRGEFIYGHVRTFPKSEREILAAQAIQSLVVVPIFVGGTWWGFIGFDECVAEREWSAAERDALRVAADMLGAAIQRAKAEEAARESEEKYRILVDNIQDGVFIIKGGEMLFINEAFARMVGYTVEEVIGMNFRQLVAPEDLEIVADRYRRRQAGEDVPREYEFHMLHKDGKTRILVNMNVGLVDYRGRVASMGTVKDVTERRRAEEALREGEEKYRTILEKMEESYYEVDIAGNLTFFNESLCRLFGYPRDELLGMNDRQYTDEATAKLLYQTFNRVYRTGESTRGLDWEVIRKDGTRRIIEASVSLRRDITTQPIGFRGVIRDITERKRAEEALREGERHYRELFEAHPLPMCIYDPASLQILAVNPAASRTYGWSREELARLTLREVWSPEELDLLESHMVEVRRDASAVHTGESWHQRRKDGTIIEVEVNAGPVSWEGRPARAFTAQDVTERRRIEDRLRQSQKLEAVGLLAGGIAHDFNNIMQAMLSLATVLRLRATSPEMATTVSEIEAHIKRGASLTQQLLLFSSRQFSQRTRLDLGEITSQAGMMLRRLIPENIHLDLDLSPERLSFDGDAVQIQQVLMNLTVNARDATPSGGAIFLRTGRQNGEVWVEVEDHGSGMTPQVQEHIFEPFFTTKEAGHGTGLGLSVVHGIIEQHGGRIEVASQPGQGSRIRVLLPKTGPPDAELAATAREDDLPRGHGGRILIVEDESGVREGIEQITALLGYTATAVGSGEAALALASEPGFDLLLTDLMLPGIDGPTLANLLCERWPQLRVILMSGYAEDESVRREVKSGAMTFLQKPFDIASFAHALHATLEG